MTGSSGWVSCDSVGPIFSPALAGHRCFKYPLKVLYLCLCHGWVAVTGLWGPPPSDEGSSQFSHPWGEGGQLFQVCVCTISRGSFPFRIRARFPILGVIRSTIPSQVRSSTSLGRGHSVWASKRKGQLIRTLIFQHMLQHTVNMHPYANRCIGHTHRR